MKTLVQRVSPCVWGGMMVLLGCSTSTPTKPAQAPVKVAVQADETDALAATALQRRFKEQKPAEALKLLERAVKRAPERPEILWLNFVVCAQVPGCNTEALEAQLLKVDPDNGAVLLGPLVRAQISGDQAAESAALEALARSTKFRLYWNTLLSKLGSAQLTQVATRSQPVTRSLNEVTDWYSTLASAMFRPILTACDFERTALDRVANARCTRIAGLLLQGDTYIAESVGLGLAEQLLAGEQVQRVLERGALSKYQRETASQIINAQLDREKLSGQLLELMSKVPREQDVFMAVVRWGGQSLVPIEP